MTRFLLPALVLLLQAHALPALAAASAPEPQATMPQGDTPARTMTQNSRVELPAPPPSQGVPPAPTLHHVSLRGK